MHLVSCYVVTAYVVYREHCSSARAKWTYIAVFHVDGFQTSFGSAASAFENIWLAYIHCALKENLRVTLKGFTQSGSWVNIKREMVSSPSDESKKKLILLKTIPNSRLEHKQYPISDQNCRNWYPIGKTKRLKKTIPFGAAHTYIARLRWFPGFALRITRWPP